jgi:hypothetical protein
MPLGQTKHLPRVDWDKFLPGKRNSFDVFKSVVSDHSITDPERGYNRKKTALQGKGI